MGRGWLGLRVVVLCFLVCVLAPPMRVVPMLVQFTDSSPGSSTVPGSGVVVVQSLSCTWLFGTPRTAACQASLSFTISRSLLTLVYFELMMPPNHLTLCLPLLLLPSVFPSFMVFSKELALRIKWPKYRIFNFIINPSNEYSGLIFFRIDWFVSLLTKGLSRVFSSTIFQKCQFLGTQLSLWSNSHIPDDYWKNHSFDYMDFCWQSDVSAF